MAGPPVTIDLNPREQRLYDRLRARLVTPAEVGDHGLSPTCCSSCRTSRSCSRACCATPGSRSSTRASPSPGIAYVLSPIDVLPAIVLGPVGLLDDLFIVAACLSRLLNHVHPDVVRSHWSGQGDALEVIQGTTSWFERELSLRVGDLRRFLDSRPGR